MENFEFPTQIDEKFRFFQANLWKFSIFPVKLTNNFDFLGKNFRMTFFSHLLQNVLFIQTKFALTDKF